jgi:hypothetical protein
MGKASKKFAEGSPSSSGGKRSSTPAPPLVVHTNVDYDSYTMALGYRLLNKPRVFKIDKDSRLDKMWDKNFIAMHGEDFCRCIVKHIVTMNVIDISNYAAKFSEKYRDRHEELISLVFEKKTSESFTQAEFVEHGEMFLTLVLRHCRNILTMMAKELEQRKVDEVNTASDRQVNATAMHDNGPQSAPLPSQSTSMAPISGRPSQDARRIRSDGEAHHTAFATVHPSSPTRNRHQVDGRPGSAHNFLAPESHSHHGHPYNRGPYIPHIGSPTPQISPQPWATDSIPHSHPPYGPPSQIQIHQHPMMSPGMMQTHAAMPSPSFPSPGFRMDSGIPFFHNRIHHGHHGAQHALSRVPPDSLAMPQPYAPHPAERFRAEHPSHKIYSPRLMPSIPPVGQNHQAGHYPVMGPEIHPRGPPFILTSPPEVQNSNRKNSKGTKSQKGRRNSVVSDQSRSMNVTKHYDRKHELNSRPVHSSGASTRRTSFTNHTKHSPPTETPQYMETQVSEPFPHLLEDKEPDTSNVVISDPMDHEDTCEEFYIGKNVMFLKSMFVGRIARDMDESYVEVALSEFARVESVGIINRKDHAETSFTFVT